MALSLTPGPGSAAYMTPATAFNPVQSAQKKRGLPEAMHEEPLARDAFHGHHGGHSRNHPHHGPAGNGRVSTMYVAADNVIVGVRDPNAASLVA